MDMPEIVCVDFNFSVDLLHILSPVLLFILFSSALLFYSGFPILFLAHNQIGLFS